MDIKKLIEDLNKYSTDRNMKKGELLYKDKHVGELDIIEISDDYFQNPICIHAAVESQNKRDEYEADFSLDLEKKSNIRYGMWVFWLFSK